VVVEDAADEVSVGVELLPDGVVIGGGVVDVEGARAASAHHGRPFVGGVERPVRLDVAAFADRAVTDGLARLPRWRRRAQRLGDGLAGRGRRGEHEDASGTERAEDEERAHDDAPFRCELRLISDARMGGGAKQPLRS
jgi:hypothetical protein